MKKFEEMFKRITNWGELVIGKRYHVVPTGDRWYSIEEKDCIFSYKDRIDSNVLMDETGCYFPKDCLEDDANDFMIAIFEYLEEE